jgi:hypothetical protein
LTLTAGGRHETDAPPLAARPAGLAAADIRPNENLVTDVSRPSPSPWRRRSAATRSSDRSRQSWHPLRREILITRFGDTAQVHRQMPGGDRCQLTFFLTA